MFESISQIDLPEGRKGKHHTIVAHVLQAIEELEAGRALKDPARATARHQGQHPVCSEPNVETKELGDRHFER